MYENENENKLSVEKYLKAITVMTNSVGKLDVLKCHLQSTYNDTMSVAILDNIISDLAKAVGMEYKPIEVKIPEVKQNFNTSYPVNREPLIVNILPSEEVKEEEKQITATNSSMDFAKYMDIAEKTINETFKKKEVKKQQEKNNKVVSINQSKGVEIDTVTGKMVYNFVNSSTLSLMIYDRTKKEMMMTFLRNGRTYLYKNIPMFIVDNLIQLDEKGTASVGSYFQQNVVKKAEKYPYKEMTDEQYIG